MFFKRTVNRKTAATKPLGSRLRFEQLEQRQLLTTFYLSPTGNDNNPGTAAAPMASLAHVEGSMKAGDSALLESGTYQWNAAVWWTKSGTAAAPITISSAPGASAIISGSSMPAQSITLGIQASDVTVQNLTFTNAKGVGLEFYTGANCIANNIVVKNSQDTGIHVGDNADTTMQLSQNDIVENCVVYNNDLENSPAERTANSGWGAGISVFGAKDIVIKNNSVYDNFGEGIDIIQASWCYAQNNTIQDNFSVEMYLDNATYDVVQNNFIDCSGNSAYYRNGVGAIGISMANEAHAFQNLNDNDTIQNNIVSGGAIGFATFDSYGLGYAFRNTLVINNTFYGASEEIVSIQNSMGTNVGDRLANNIFEQTGTTAPLAVFQAGGVTYDHNLWWGGNSNNAGMNGVADVWKNPLLNAAGGSSVTGYQLGSGSPAIATGTAAAAPSGNFWWVARGSSIDIGAW